MKLKLLDYSFQSDHFMRPTRAKWSKGDQKRPNRAHKIKVLVTIKAESKTAPNVKEFIEKRT